MNENQKYYSIISLAPKHHKPTNAGLEYLA